MSIIYVGKEGIELKEAVRICKPGDTIMIVDEVYNLSSNVSVTTDFVTITSESAIVNGLDKYNIYIHANHITFSRIVVKRCDYGLQVNGNGCTVEYCAFRGNYSGGMKVEGSEHVIRHCDIHHNYDMSSGFIHGIGIDITGDNHRISHCNILEQPEAGIIGSQNGCRNCILDNNIISSMVETAPHICTFYGINLGKSDATSNMIANNVIDADIGLFINSRNTITGNTILGHSYCIQVIGVDNSLFENYLSGDSKGIKVMGDHNKLHCNMVSIDRSCIIVPSVKNSICYNYVINGEEGIVYRKDNLVNNNYFYGNDKNRVIDH